MWQAEHEERCELCGRIIKSMDYFPYQLKLTEYTIQYTLCDKCSESLCKWVERKIKLNKSESEGE